MGPTPRPDVYPVAPGSHLLFAQSGKIELVPLDGYSMKKEEAKPLLHVPVRKPTPDGQPASGKHGRVQISCLRQQFISSTAEADGNVISSVGHLVVNLQKP